MGLLRYLPFSYLPFGYLPFDYLYSWIVWPFKQLVALSVIEIKNQERDHLISDTLVKLQKDPNIIIERSNNKKTALCITMHLNSLSTYNFIKTSLIAMRLTDANISIDIPEPLVRQRTTRHV